MKQYNLTPDTVVVKIEARGTRLVAIDAKGNKVNGPSKKWKTTAFDTNCALAEIIGSTGRGYWRPVEMDEFNSRANIPAPMEPIEVPNDHGEVLDFIHSSYKLKPASLVMNELKWKYLVRSAVRGKNIMMTGPAGCGKTMAARALVKSLDRPDFYFNMGATQDPRATLIGNTHFSKDTGTYFTESAFVKAIMTSNAVILMDELSRAHPDAWNILMTVLDEGQRYLRLDEAEGQATIKVAEGVTFIATANVGNEYTSTRVMDRALVDRFTQIEMDVLNKDQEAGLLKALYPDVDFNILENLAELSHITRVESQGDDGKLSTHVSTRTSVEAASLIHDGFTLSEAAEVTVLPRFDSTGGLESERTYVKQVLQKFLNDGSSDELFSDVEEDAENLMDSSI
jgi:MoxR-like ATPase